jgi:glycosyltransferase involved in cell wall biosynthesis
MRIMHISTRLIVGGSQENTVLSCEGQTAHGHAVALVYGPIYGPEGSLLQRAQRSGTIELIETPHLVRQIAPLTDWRCSRDLRKIIRRWKPDVVHTHSSKAGILGRAAAWSERVPKVVHTIHGLPFHPYQNKLVHSLYVRSERFAAKRCHTIICVADAMREQAVAQRIGKPTQYVTIYSGMEVDQFLHPKWKRHDVRRELGFTDEDFVLGTVSRLAELKGHDDLLDALGEMMRSNDRLKLLWVGDGYWRDRLFERVRRMGFSGQVVSTGLVPPEEIPKYMQAMDALAHPSYREGLPRAVTQASLSGLPTIVYDLDGAPEVCVHEKTGTLVPPGKSAALRDAVLRMIEHPQLRERMGQAGREFCRHRFDVATMVAELEKVYTA